VGVGLLKAIDQAVAPGDQTLRPSVVT
jgi:hypothetical protein